MDAPKQRDFSCTPLTKSFTSSWTPSQIFPPNVPRLWNIWNYETIHETHETIQSSRTNQMKRYSRLQRIIWNYTVVQNQYVYFFELLFPYFLFSLSLKKCWNILIAFVKQRLMILALKAERLRRITLIPRCRYRGENNSRTL